MTSTERSEVNQSGTVDFFISYSNADSDWAGWVAWQLEDAGYRTIIQSWDIRPGANFVVEMQRASEIAERTIVILSPNYLSSLYTQAEWAAAFAQDPTGSHRKLIPVRVRNCVLRGLWRSIVYIDLVGLDGRFARARLLTGVSQIRAKPEVAPAFPTGRKWQLGTQPEFPGALPGIWNVPLNRKPDFTGRVGFLAELQRILRSDEASVVVVAVHGLAGVGKTRAVTEYIYKHSREYTLVWWIRSEEEATLAEDYAMLAEHLDLPDTSTSQQRVVIDAVRRKLAGSRGWLLVFDNVRNPEMLLSYLPQGGNGCVLITSINPNWGGIAHAVELRVFTEAESVDFLQRRLQRPFASASAIEAAYEIARLVDFLPLALEQAGGYISKTGCSLTEYASRYRVDRSHLRSLGIPVDYHATVATTWEMSFTEISHATPEAALFMTLLAFFAPDDIPIDYIRERLSLLPPRLQAVLADSLKTDSAVAALKEWSLIERTGGSLSIHRLVQTVARERLRPEEEKKWAEIAVRIVHSIFPEHPEDRTTWSIASRLLGHALAAVAHIERWGFDNLEAGQLLHRAFVYCHERAQGSDSDSLHRYTDSGLLSRTTDVLSRIVRTFRSSGLQIPSDLFAYYGNVLRLEDRYNDARQAYVEALGVSRDEDAARAAVLVGLANVQKTVQQYPEAEGHLREALRIYNQVSSDPEGRASCMFVLSNVLFAQSKWSEAYQIYRDALSLYRMPPAKAVSLRGQLNCLKGMCDVLIKKKEYDTALSVISEALDLYARFKETGLSKLTEAKITQGLGDVTRLLVVQQVMNNGSPRHQLVSRSETAYNTAIRLYKELSAPLGEALSLYKLGELYVFSRSLSDARNCFEQARAVFERCEGNQLGLAKAQLAIRKLSIVEGTVHAGLIDELAALVRIFRDDCKSVYWEAESLLTLGACHIRLSNIHDAKQVIVRAQMLFAKLDREDKVAIGWQIIAGQYTHLEAFSE
ncbi:MAG: TIR domain-containing protein [Chloroflexi bacterium]|nr:TIR domain-containing protein [Chloroflexota bacterium]